MKIEWNKVTRFSQFIAIVLFVFIFYYGFYLGRQVGVYKTLGNVVNDVVFSCDDNKSIRAQFYERAVLIWPPNEHESFLLQTISASGARYANSDESLVFWNKGAEALIMRNNQMDLNLKNCKTN